MTCLKCESDELRELSMNAQTKAATDGVRDLIIMVSMAYVGLHCDE